MSETTRQPREINEHTGKPHAKNWKGGSVASNGYKLVYVGKDHHLADVRGYTYEHRLVAEREAGRRIMEGEQVHHEDQSRLNNEPGNLKIKASRAEHALSHRKRHDLRLPGEPNPIIDCACGCGDRISKFDWSGRPRRFVSGHNPPSRPETDAVLAAISYGLAAPQEIAAFTNRELRATRTLLSKLARDGKIVRRAHGLYGPQGASVIVRENPVVSCGCGCGTAFTKFDFSWRERRFVPGHNSCTRWM